MLIILSKIINIHLTPIVSYPERINKYQEVYDYQNRDMSWHVFLNGRINIYQEIL